MWALGLCDVIVLRTDVMGVLEHGEKLKLTCQKRMACIYSD